MPLTHLTAADFRVMPWANGLGRTVELYRREDADGQLLVRLSVADVVADGPFSTLPGIDRVLTLIEGEGFDLDFAGTAPVAPARPFVPVGFSGDWQTSAVDLKGPSRDFNVMTRRGAFSVDVTHLGAGDHMLAPPQAGAPRSASDPDRCLCCLYVVTGTASVDGGPESVRAHDLVLIEGATPVTVASHGDLLVIRLLARP